MLVASITYIIQVCASISAPQGEDSKMPGCEHNATNSSLTSAAKKSQSLFDGRNRHHTQARKSSYHRHKTEAEMKHQTRI
jgi:hypothetical protein